MSENNVSWKITLWTYNSRDIMPAIFCSMHLITSLTNPLVAHALKLPLPFMRSANISSEHSGIGGKNRRTEHSVTVPFLKVGQYVC